MTAQISSIQVGRIVTQGDPGTRDVGTRRWTSAFDKRPVVGAVSVGKPGIEGDQVADTKHHGGVDKAVLCYADAHYQAWQTEYPDIAWTGGGFGENLTIAGADESTTCLGDQYAIGECVIEVSQPRQPCWKISRRWGDKTLTRRVTQTGRTGWYVRVIRPGTIAAGMPLELRERPHPDWTIRRLNDLMFGRASDRAALHELMSLPKLAQAWKKDIA